MALASILGGTGPVTCGLRGPSPWCTGPNGSRSLGLLRPPGLPRLRHVRPWGLLGLGLDLRLRRFLRLGLGLGLGLDLGLRLRLGLGLDLGLGLGLGLGLKLLSLLRLPHSGGFGTRPNRPPVPDPSPTAWGGETGDKGSRDLRTSGLETVRHGAGTTYPGPYDDLDLAYGGSEPGRVMATFTYLRPPSLPWTRERC